MNKWTVYLTACQNISVKPLLFLPQAEVYQALASQAFWYL
jgi:hypothetical protein